VGRGSPGGVACFSVGGGYVNSAPPHPAAPPAGPPRLGSRPDYWPFSSRQEIRRAAWPLLLYGRSWRWV
jgi:hypothetical protein